MPKYLHGRNVTNRLFEEEPSSIGNQGGPRGLHEASLRPQAPGEVQR